MGNKISRGRAIVDERYTRPQGLYEHKDVDQKKLRRLILDAKLAPCYPGNEDQIVDLEECPICFLFYPSLNRSKCCFKYICTECFLQTKAAHSGQSTQCPFCKMPTFAVEYRGAKTFKEKEIEQAEEQKVIEAKIKIRQRELKAEQEEIQRKEKIGQHGRFAIRSSLMRENFSSSSGCDSSAIAVITPGAIARLCDRSPPLEESRTALEGRHPLFSEVEQHGVLLPERLMGRARTLPQPADVSTSSHSQRENESGLSFMQPERVDEVDMDLEEMMVMEAIWLSIEEQNPQWHSSLSSSRGYMATSGFINCAVDMELSIHENHEEISSLSAMEDTGDTQVKTSVTGGLASALTVVTETRSESVDSVGIVQGGDFSTTCHENFLFSRHNCLEKADRPVSIPCDLPQGEDIPEVSSAYATSTRFDTLPAKEHIYKDRSERNSVVESDALAQSRRVMPWHESDGNERLDSWIEISLDSGKVLSAV